MNEEEKEAIEKIKGLEILFEIDDNKDFEATPLVQKEIAKDLKILLNLIDKMKNCINILDDELKERNKTINEKEIIIEKLQKENEELKESNRKLYEIGQEMCKQDKYTSENYIPVQKVKDKIEELNSRIEKYREYVEQGIETDVEWVDNVADRETVKVLQELLEGRK